MTGVISASVTLYVDVFDSQEMWRSAFAAFEASSGTADQSDFEEMCGTEEQPDICACLQLIFDPGESPAGTQIEDCCAELAEPS